MRYCFTRCVRRYAPGAYLRRPRKEPSSPGFDMASTCNGRQRNHGMSFMSDKFFVDTNILMYAHDKGSGARHEKSKELVEQLWRDRSGVISTQVLQELAVNLRKKARKPLAPAATRELIADYMTWQVVVNDGEAILDALDIEKRYRISFWDALIVQAAQSCGVEILYSEDLADRQNYGSVRIVNPLVER